MSVKKANKHKLSLLSWKKRKRIRSKSEKGKPDIGSFVVLCAIHGVPGHKMPKEIAWVKVGYPNNKRQALRGCPMCAK